MSFRFNQGDRPLAGYTIHRGVGRGGFGEVYYALSDGGKEVALKYLRDNPQIELRGATHCLNLKSPHLVSIQDIRQSAAGEFFVIMEFVHGPSLRDLMNEEPGGLGVQKAAFFLREIGKGLAYLHDRGIVHRDLKPGNIFYEDGYVKIGDYGLSKMMAASAYSGQTVSVGTVHYMAPEVGSGNYDRSIDLYALGVILYEMLLGRVPFSGSSMGEVLMKHLTAAPEVDELPAPFPHVIRKALAKDPRDRYQSVGEMMEDVFAIESLNRSVAGIDSLNLTRMAAAVAQKVKTGAHARGGGPAFGSSNVAPLDAAPPPVLQVDRPPPPVFIPHRSELRHTDSKGTPGLFALPDEQTFPRRSRLTTGLLGLFLGPLGVHRFYTGHYSIGVWQLIVSLTTFLGGLWGVIEGIIILMNGDFRDVLGRPLIDRSPSDPTHRNVLFRVFWGLFGLAMFLCAIAFTAVGTFAGPEYERISGLAPESFYLNMFRLFYLGAVATLCLGCFALWKAAHRGGYSSWRVTVRPAFMTVCAILAGVSLVGANTFAPYSMQLPLLASSVVACFGFLILWLLRGSTEYFRASDVYWNRALMNLFIVAGLMLGSAAGLCGYLWGRHEFRIERLGDRFSERTVDSNFVPEVWRGSRRKDRDKRPESVRLPVPELVFDMNAPATFLFGLLAIGAMAEADYRRRAAKLAKAATSGTSGEQR